MQSYLMLCHVVSQHKKLVEGTLYEEVSSASYSENDISNSLKNGILYLEDPIDHVRVSESDYSSNKPSACRVTETCFSVIHRRGRRIILS